MQEVVKRLQEKQERQKEPKMPEYVTLVIAKWQGKQYPVVFPQTVFYVQPGDLVWFKPEGQNGMAACGDVLYVDDYCEYDGKIWTLASITTGMEPIKVIRYARTSDVNWEEESK